LTQIVVALSSNGSELSQVPIASNFIYVSQAVEISNTLVSDISRSDKILSTSNIVESPESFNVIISSSFQISESSIVCDSSIPIHSVQVLESTKLCIVSSTVNFMKPDAPIILNSSYSLDTSKSSQVVYAPDSQVFQSSESTLPVVISNSSKIRKSSNAIVISFSSNIGKSYTSKISNSLNSM
jgi:hypothetical protein